MQDIPCDMSRSNFCAVPGSSYPWSSVRRYIFENQGLMRRMYGDQRHSHVMKNEILDEIHDKYDSLALKGFAMYRPQFSPRSAVIDPLTPQQQAEQYHTKLSTASPVVASTEWSKASTDKAYAAPEGQGEPSLSLNITANVTETALPQETSASAADFDFEDETTTAAPLLSKEEVPASVTKQEEPKKDADQGEEPSAAQHSSTSTTTASTTAGTAADFETEPIEKKGVNACPVKEEVILSAL